MVRVCSRNYQVQGGRILKLGKNSALGCPCL